MIAKLKPCPFCGNKDPDIVLYYEDGKEASREIVCQKCGAAFHVKEAVDVIGIIVGWNRRVNNAR